MAPLSIGLDDFNSNDSESIRNDLQIGQWEKYVHWEGRAALEKVI